jgi:hypothetical protein
MTCKFHPQSASPRKELRTFWFCSTVQTTALGPLHNQPKSVQMSLLDKLNFQTVLREIDRLQPSAPIGNLLQDLKVLEIGW